MSKEYFVMEGARFKGQGELDFLAVKLDGDKVRERLHVEVHVSGNPVTNLGQKRAGAGTNPRQGAVQFIERKFLRPGVAKAAKRVFRTDEFSKLLVLGNVNSERVVIGECRAHNIEVVRFWRVCLDLRSKSGKLETTDGRRF